MIVPNERRCVPLHELCLPCLLFIFPVKHTWVGVKAVNAYLRRFHEAIHPHDGQEKVDSLFLCEPEADNADVICSSQRILSC